MKVQDLKPGKQYRTQSGHVVTYIGISQGYEQWPRLKETGHTLVDCLMFGRLYMFASFDLIDEV